MIRVRLILLRTRLIVGNLAFWSHGACVVYASEIFDPKTVVDAVVGEKCTALHGVPTHFLGVLTEVDKRQAEGDSLDLSHLRYGFDAKRLVLHSKGITLEQELLEHPQSPFL